MKTMMNFTTSPEDTERYASAEDLRAFYRSFGCDGLELMPTGEADGGGIITPDMVVGVHLPCLSDWMDREEEHLLAHYRPALDAAQRLGAEYVVFHAAQISDEECFTYRIRHSDREVADAVCSLVNRLLDGQPYTFYFLMENLWWPGLNFLDPQITRRLLDGVHYSRKGLMLDTGHFLHTNHALRNQGEAVAYLHDMLDRHGDLIPWIRGLHLQQSLTGAYVEEWLRREHVLSPDPEERFRQVYEHVFAIDRHLPFTDPGVRGLVERIDPRYVTYEYITRDREEHARYLRAGTAALRGSRKTDKCAGEAACVQAEASQRRKQASGR
ncbi:MAG: sugar phosphate isomerase/epimerase [Lachnospiraceae bacterium]|nr:sugar phosphate isomerase/epimerase [Lachnospiraceae bacterium]